MRPFERLDEGEKQIIRHQWKKFKAYCQLFHEEVIPSIPTDDEEEGEIIPRAPATMQQQENGWGYNEREFIGEDMPRKTGTPGPQKGVPIEYKKERKQKKRGAVRNRVGPRVRHKAQAPVTIGAADIVAKKRPELRGKS